MTVTVSARSEAWSIRRRVLTTLAVVSGVLILVSGEPVRRLETAAMVNIIREQYASSLESLVPALQDHVITRDADMDLPVLQRIASDFRRTHPAVLSMRIQDSDGNSLVEESVSGSFEQDRTFEVSRELMAGEFSVGSVGLVIDLRPIEAQAGRHALKLQAVFAALILLVAFILVGLFYRLAVHPLRKIDDKLKKLVSGEDISSEEFRGAEEFLRLNDSVDALASAVQLQERQQELEQQLQQSQKLEAIGRLAGGVAHDFNNLLTVILGYAETLMEDPGLGKSGRNSASQIVSAGERAAALTRQLLAFSRKQVMQSSLVDPVEVLKKMEQMLDRLIGELVEIKVDVRGEVGLVSIDPTQFEQVILNLAVNARDAMRQGGVLKFALYPETVEVGVSSATSVSPIVPPGNYIVLSVQDNGSGMDRETQGRIFEPFFTTKKSGEGTGLGLAMVYGIISQSGGFIDLESEVDEGTTFLVYLLQVDGVLESPELSVVHSHGKPGATILLVEDEGLVRTLTQEILETEGYRVLVAEDSEKALRVSEGHSARIDLLLTDLVLPGMSGSALSKTIEEHRPDIKTLLVSGYDNQMLGTEYREMPFLQKPFDRTSLLRKVSDLLDTGD